MTLFEEALARLLSLQEANFLLKLEIKQLEEELGVRRLKTNKATEPKEEPKTNNNDTGEKAGILIPMKK